MGSQVYVRMIAFPRTVNAVTLPNDDGSFDVYINAKLPPELQVKALEHELEHINRDHFYNEDPVGRNELEAG
ncbi:MAG: hypothetical protein IJ960_06905 [Oscillospiraceae bacterium]|nr:hypothetical protein [Oscillospiraceae bacterium]